MIRRALDAVRWYVGGVMGDSLYAYYQRHMSARHPGEPVLTEGDYWRERHAAADRNPGSRCC